MPSNSQVAHMWAAHNMGTTTKDSAKSSNGNFRFAGSAIYSYSTCMAVFAEAPNGERYVMRNGRSYSITTSGKHQPAISDALHGLNLARIVTVDGEPKRGEWTVRAAPEIVAALLTEAETLQAKAKRARSNREWLLRQAGDVIADAQWMAAAHGLPFTDADGMIAALRREREGAEVMGNIGRFFAQYNQAAAAFFDRPLVALSAIADGIMWLAGGPSLGGYPYRYSGNVPTLLRIEGDKVRTCRGAEFPLEHGVKALPFIRTAMEHGGFAFSEGCKGAGARLGHFKIDRIAEDGTVTAGCHTVPLFAIKWAARCAGACDAPELDHVAAALATVREHIAEDERKGEEERRAWVARQTWQPGQPIPA